MIQIETKGLRELARNAKKLGDTGVTNGLKDASFRSAQIVVNRGRVIAGATGRPASIIAAESLRASKSAGKAAVIFGRNGVPWLVGNNFGAGGNRYPQFPRKGRGEFLYRAIGDTRQQVTEAFADGLEKIISREL